VSIDGSNQLAGGGFAIVAEMALEVEERGFVEAVAEESQQSSDRQDYASCTDYAQGFGVEVGVDELTNGRGEHLLQGIVKDVETIAVFSKEAHGRVLEEMLDS